jgi:hypothetical protein
VTRVGRVGPGAAAVGRPVDVLREPLANLACGSPDSVSLLQLDLHGF